MAANLPEYGAKLILKDYDKFFKGLEGVDKALNSFGKTASDALKGFNSNTPTAVKNTNNLKRAFSDLNGLTSGVSSGISGIGTSLGKLGLGAGIATGVVAAGFLALGNSAVDSASDAEETINKFNAVFKGEAGGVKESLDDLALSLGRSTTDLQNYAASFQSTFVPLGFARDQAADMSLTLVELAEDLASFSNIDSTEAAHRLRSGLIGNTEALAELNIAANEFTVKQKAMELGYAATSAALPPAVKAHAIYAVILDQTTDAQGDALRTSEAYANQQRGLGSDITNLKVAIGQVLLPTWLKFLTGLRSAMPIFEVLGKAIAHSFTQVVSVAGTMLKDVAAAFGINFSQLAQNSNQWGADVIVQFANGMAAGMVAVIQAIGSIGQTLAYWLQPNSPPKVAPNIDQWGTDAINQFALGLGNMDTAVFDDIANMIETHLREISVDDNDTNLIGSIIGSRSAIADGLAAVDGVGSNIASVVDGIAMSVGGLPDPVKNYTAALLESKIAATDVAEAQENVNAITEKFDGIIEPLVVGMADLEAGFDSTLQTLQDDLVELEGVWSGVIDPLVSNMTTLEKTLSDTTNSFDTDIERMKGSLQGFEDDLQNSNDIYDGLVEPLTDSLATLEATFDSVARGYAEDIQEIDDNVFKLAHTLHHTKLRAEEALTPLLDSLEELKGSLDETRDKFDEALTPLKNQNDELKRQQKALRDIQKTKRLEEKIADPETDAIERQIAQIELERIALEQNIDTKEREKKVAVDAEQAKIDAKEKLIKTTKLEHDENIRLAKEKLDDEKGNKEYTKREIDGDLRDRQGVIDAKKREIEQIEKQRELSNRSIEKQIENEKRLIDAKEREKKAAVGNIESQIETAQAEIDMQERLRDVELEEAQAKIELEEQRKTAALETAQAEIDMQEGLKKAALDTANAELEAAQKVDEAAKEKLSTQQFILDSYNKQNDLLKEQQKILADIEKEKNKPSGSGGGSKFGGVDIIPPTTSNPMLDMFEGIAGTGKSNELAKLAGLGDKSLAGRVQKAFAPVLEEWETFKSVFDAEEFVGNTKLKFDELLLTFGAFQKMIADLTTTLAPFSGIILTVIGVFAGLSVISSVIGMLANLQLAWAAIATVITTVVVPVVSGIAAIIGWPITIAIAAVAALALAWKTNFLDIQGFTADMITVLRDAFVGLGLILVVLADVLVGAVQWIVTNGVEILVNAWMTGTDTIKGFIQGLQDRFADFQLKLSEIFELVKLALTTLVEFASEKFTTFTAKISETKDAAETAFSEMIANITGFFTDTDWLALGVMVFKGILTPISMLWSGGETVGAGIAELLGMLFDSVVGWFSEQDWAQGGISVVTKITDVIGDLWDGAVGAGVGVKVKLAGFATDIKGWFASSERPWASFGRGMVDTIVEGFQGAIGFLTSGIQGAIDAAINAVTPDFGNFDLNPFDNNFAGTSSYAGGITNIGERGRELFTTPSGITGLATRTIMALPKGTEIFSNPQTEKMINGFNRSQGTAVNLSQPTVITNQSSTTQQNNVTTNNVTVNVPTNPDAQSLGDAIQRSMGVPIRR